MIILLTGNIGSGKSLSAKILCELFNLEEVTFSEPLKKFAISLGFTYEQVYGTQEQKLQINDFWNISGREFLQKFGTDVCRDVLPKIMPKMNMNNSQVWARVMEKKIIEKGELVISDGRFMDEVRLVKKYGGIVLRITRNMDKGGSEYKHKSEEVELPYDFLVDNNGTVEDLRERLLSIFIKDK